MAPQDPMVKRTLCALVAALAAAAGWGLAAPETVMLAPSEMAFPGVRPSAFASLLAHGTGVTVVYADRETTSLAVVDVPAVAALPAAAPGARFVDKVDIAPPLGGFFGLHAAAIVDGRLSLLYVDREKDDRQLLKRVTEDDAGWRLELVEPFGPPVAFLPGPRGEPIDSWAPGALLLRDAAGDRVLREPFLLRGQSMPLGGGRSLPPPGFGCWDDAGGELVVVRMASRGAELGSVPGASPVSALAEAPDGGLAAVTWDPDSRRILLLERSAGERTFRRTTVVICDGTNGVFLAWTPSGWLFVYDEVKPAPLGRWTWELCLLAPQPRAVGRPRYRRGVLSTGSREISGFRALLDDGSLFVLEMRDGLRLFKTAVP
jgi:hypothetical protein